MFKGRKSYFYKFFLNFALMLSVPLILIFVVFGYADRVIRNQILDSASNSLNQSAEKFDETIEDMREICYDVIVQKECLRYATYAVNMPDQVEMVEKALVDELGRYPQEKYSDVFVYFYGNNRIVSAKGPSLEAEDYYDAYYAEATGSDFEKAFSKVIKSGSEKPYWHVMNSGSKEPYLCMALSVDGEEFTEYSYTVGVVLNPEYARDLLSLDEGKEDSFFMVLCVPWIKDAGRPGFSSS